MFEWLKRLMSLGVTGQQPPAEVRRLQAVNLVALLAVFFNLVYDAAFLFVDAGGLALVITTNGVSAALAVGVLAMNRAGRGRGALYLLMVTGPFNLIAASLLLGTGTGVFLFLLALPVTGVLMAPSSRRDLQVMAIAMGTVALLVVGLIDPEVPDSIAGTAVETGLLAASIVGTSAFLGVAALHFKRVADAAETELLRANERSERLLLNILPEEIAERLKAGEEVIADRAEEVTILFADLVGSTPLSERLTADEMVQLLNEIFTPFDDLADDLGLEKIKTVGDAYMVVGGLPTARPDHVEAIAEMALSMRAELENHSVEGFGKLEMRYGIHTGPVVAGVIGKRKFSYDLWGDTVNTAARMESHGLPGEIQVTPAVHSRLQGGYELVARGPVDVKGKGTMETYLLKSRAPARGTHTSDQPRSTS